MERLKTNHKLELAREFILNTRANIFLTGKAGTGKTTLLRNVVKEMGKRVVIAAPTGVAALNAGGVTLHSLFQLPFGAYIPGQSIVGRRISKRKLALIRSLEMLIIDEVSMVRSDMLDAIDHTLKSIRRNQRAFGGVQLLMIGDIQQLSPICKEEEWEMLEQHYSTPYFFDSKALSLSPYVTIELDEIFRQSDPHFTSLLNAVRENRVSREELERLNRRYIPNFSDEEYITLTTHNNTANAINSTRLAAINNPSYYFEATISGEFSQSAYPNDTTLELKCGAQVLFIKNDISPDKRYYNGLIGRVVSIDNKSVTVAPDGGGEQICVEAISWDNIEYNVNSESGEMEQNVKGSFRQIPLRCAWAITIHKSQGLSFDRAIIDASSSFAHGQLYVALSRCRTMEGMVLRSPIPPTAIIEERRVESYSEFVATNQPTPEVLEAYKRDYFAATLCEVFDFSALHRLLWELVSEMKGALSKSYPKLTASLIELMATFDANIVRVGESFCRQIRQMIGQCNDPAEDSLLRERLVRASEYFTPRLEPLRPILETLQRVEPDSAESKRRMREMTGELNSQLELLFVALTLCGEGFSIEGYLRERCRVISLRTLAEGAKATKKRDTKQSPKSEEQEGEEDLLHPELYATLQAWRAEEAKEIAKPAYVVLTNRSLMGIQKNLPRTHSELGSIHGMGRVKMERYSSQILEIVADYIEGK